MYNSFYNQAPLPIQELLLSLRASARMYLREDTTFRKIDQEIDEQFYWDRHIIDDWKLQKLGELLKRVEAHVPHYRVARAEWDVRNVEARLAQYPLLKKSVIAQAPGNFVAEDTRVLMKFSGSTSGTTGTPLKLTQSMTAIRRENAFLWRQMRWAGFQRGQRRVWLRGDLIVPAANRGGIYWRRNRAENMLMMSSYHLSDSTARAYLDALREFDPVLIQAFPSSIGYLASWMWERGITLNVPSLKGIVTSSETLTSEQRERIEVTFGVRVFDWYGSFERVAAIGTCSAGHYHVMEDYGYTEFLPAQDGLHEVVATGFNNDLMPLVRYSSGDLVELSEETGRCECGSCFQRVNRILGRMDDIVKTPDGRAIGRLTSIYKGLTGILEAQIVQEKREALEIRVVPAAGIVDTAGITSTIIKNLRARVGPDMDISVHFVDSIPRTKNGKLRAVVCKI